MKDMVSVILGRRSTRLFTEEELKRADLEKILECARWAPSANNLQPWHFTAILDRDLIDEVNTWVLAEINRHNSFRLEKAKVTAANIFRNSPCVIIISVDKKDRFAEIDASAAAQNILLAAEDLGLGSCWIGKVHELANSPLLEEYAIELGLPQGFVPLFGITLGYKAGPSQQSERKTNTFTIIEKKQ